MTKKLEKYPTRSELKERGITRREHELMYQWFENGCKSFADGEEVETSTEGGGVTFETSPEGGLGITNVQ